MLTRHSYVIAAARTAVLAPLFILGCVSLVVLQEVAKAATRRRPAYLQAVINLTKTQFVVLLTFVASIVSPTRLEVTTSAAANAATGGTARFRAHNGHLVASISPNLVLISNHQIYTDWLLLWHILACLRLGDSVYIFLKDLLWIPVLGPGMRNFNFLFLLRKWEKDKVVLSNQLLEIDANARGLGPANGVQRVFSRSRLRHWPRGRAARAPAAGAGARAPLTLDAAQPWPYSIILYPEGTVTSPHTRIRLNKFCAERGLAPLRHVLLPRVRGLLITLKRLRGTVSVVYDVTTGYLGLRAGENGEDIYTLKRYFLLGYGPRCIHHHFQEWRIDDIPLGGESGAEDIDEVLEEDYKRFEAWLFEVWRQKDSLMEEFYQKGSFRGEGEVVEAELKVRSLWDVAAVFVPIGVVALAVRAVWRVVVG